MSEIKGRSHSLSVSVEASPDVEANPDRVVSSDDAVIDATDRLRWHNSWKALVLIAIAGATVRLMGLDRQSFWLDEGASLFYVQQHHGMWSIISSLAQGGDNHPPIHFLALYFMTLAFDPTNEIAMRMPSVIASVSLIPAAWMLATVVAPRFRGAAALATAASPFLIWYAQEARMYAMAEAFAAWSIVAFFKASQNQSSSKWFAAHAAFRLLGFYTHVYALLLSVAELLLLPTLPAAKRRLMARTMAIEFAAMLPWFIVLYNARGNTAGTDTGSPVVAAAYSLFVFTFGYSFGPGVRSLHISHHLSTVDMIQLAAAALVSAGLLYGLWRARRNRRLLQMAVIVLAPLVMALIITVMTAVTLNARYVSIVYVPFVCIVVLALGRSWQSNIVKATAIGLAVISGVSLAQYFTLTKYEKDDYRSAMQYINARNAAGDPIYVLTYPAPASIYATDSSKIVNFAPDGNGEKNWNALGSQGIPHDSVWVLSARSWELDSDSSHLRSLLRFGTVIDQAKFPGVSVMHLDVNR